MNKGSLSLTVLPQAMWIDRTERRAVFEIRVRFVSNCRLFFGNYEAWK